MHMCCFHKFEKQVWCFLVNLLYIWMIPFCHFVRKPPADFFWMFFWLFSQLILNFIRFVIQVKETLYAYILARLIDENKYICRFHATFSVWRAVSTPRDFMKNSCCESFNIIFEAQVMHFPLHLYAKQKLFVINYSISFIFALQEHQKCIFKASRKGKMQMNFWLFNFYRYAAGLDITDVPTANFLGPTYWNSVGCWDARGWIKNSRIYYEMSGAV